MKKFVLPSLLSLVGGSAHAASNNNVDIDSGGDGIFGKLGDLMQQIVDFGGGPLVIFIIFVSLLIGWGMWTLMPKQAGPALGFIFRGVLGAIALLNIGILITWAQGF